MVSLVMALLITSLSGRGQGIDTILGVLARGALAIGLVMVTFIPGQRIDLDAYLFGDVLTVTRADLGIIWGGAAVVIAVLVSRWNAMLTATLNPDLASAAGVKPAREQLVLTLLLAAVVAVAIKVVGALLITSLLIIPAAAARGFARTPEQMVVLAALIGATSAVGGLRAAMMLDTPVGPTIVCVAVGIFAISVVAKGLRRLTRG
jgi:zinc transport system permease protein